MDGQLAWYVAGPALGLCVVACRALFNGRLGVTGGFTELLTQLGRGSLRFDWRGWFALGIVAGGLVFAVVRGGSAIDGYGWLTRTFDGSGGAVAVTAILLAGGLAIGYGAKTMGGCTSGNGLTGTSLRSPAALVSTAIFFATAIAVSTAIEALL